MNADQVPLSFIDRLLEALYGKPGALLEPGVGGRWRSDPAALQKLLRGYVDGHVAGAAEELKDLAKTLDLAVAGAVAVQYGLPAFWLEEPAKPGTIDPANPIAQFVSRRVNVAALRELAAFVEEITRDQNPIAALELGWALLAAAVEDAIVADVAKLGRELRTSDPYAFGHRLGRLSMQLIIEAVLEVVEGPALRLAARGAGWLSRPNATTLVARIATAVETKAGSNPLLAMRLKTLRERWAKRTVATSGPHPPAAGNVPGTPNGSATAPGATAPPAGPGQTTPPSSAPGAGGAPGQPPPGQRQFHFGDREPGPIPEPQKVIAWRTEIVPARWSAAERAAIAAEMRKMPGVPTWVQGLRDDTLAEIADLLASYHPDLNPKAAAGWDPLGTFSGLVQERLIGYHPKFAPFETDLRKLVSSDPYLDPGSLAFAPRVVSIEPATGRDWAARAGLTDGSWLVKTNHADAPAPFLVPAIAESKSVSNLLHVMLKARTEELRLPVGGQFAKDWERFSNLDTAFDFPRADGAYERLIVPAGGIGISRKTTWLILMGPGATEVGDLKALAREVGFPAANLHVWEPPFPRKEIEQWARRLLNRPYDRLLPKTSQAVTSGKP
jgi:hypothetical protein